MQYQTRHEQRDLHLPKARERLLDSTVNHLLKKAGVEGIFLGGSLAKGNEDLYSDIDLRIVVGADYFDEYVRQKQKLAVIS